MKQEIIKLAKKSVSEIITDVIDVFSKKDSSERLVDTMTKTWINVAEIPMSKWSFNNQWLMMMQGTADARGHKQWQSIGRNPLDWQKQISILIPLIAKSKDKESGEESSVIKGFKTIGLYAVENTYGKPLSDQYKDLKLPKMVDVAEKLGCKVRFENTKSKNAWGYLSPNPRKTEIVLGTEDQGTFFHELAHLAHLRLDGKLKNGQDPEQEAIAQLSACVLARIYGFSVENYTFKYIGHYAESHKPQAVARFCMRVSKKTAQVLDLILKTKEQIENPVVKRGMEIMVRAN